MTDPVGDLLSLLDIERLELDLRLRAPRVYRSRRMARDPFACVRRGHYRFERI